jgi:drug/metabolite transporter (DMT)-like permease
LLAFLVLHEKLSWWDCGAIGVVAGLLLVSLDSKDLQIMNAMNRLQLLLQSKPGSMLGRSVSRDKL